MRLNHGSGRTSAHVSMNVQHVCQSGSAHLEHFGLKSPSNFGNVVAAYVQHEIVTPR